MIFSSYTFLFLFFPVTYAGYLILNRFAGSLWTKLWLVAASLYFYAHSDAMMLALLGGTMLFNYLIVLLMDKAKGRKAWLKALMGLAVLENLGLLFYFKYFNFFIENANLVFGGSLALRDIVLPVGISFYTFQILSYVVEVYRGNSRRSGLLDFSVFVTFFPQLIVGPIIRHDDMIPQLEEGRFGKISGENIMLGVLLFSIGCFKKVIIADPLIGHAQSFYNVMGAGNFFEAWGAVVSYTFAYYFDFSGYIDMALGLGLFFGIKLPVNFDSPYKARNFADFWRRWNITVSQFFNDYIFKSIFHFGNKLGRLIIATLATFMVSGLWHGAGWHFIFWGLANGILVCAANIMTLKRKKLPAPLAYCLTFFFVLLVRVLFDANSMTQAVEVYKAMFDIRPLFSDAAAFFSSGLAYIRENSAVLLIAAFAAVICFFAPNTRQISEDFRPKWYYAAASGVLLAVSLFFMGEVSNFLYFQF